MGNTGNSTGTHLHLEASRTKDWNCSEFVNPCTPLGFPNERGVIVVYDEPVPQPEITVRKKSNFKWVLYANKLRKKRN